MDHDGFWWQGPDGSRVRAEYLPQGYGNGARLLADPKDLIERIRAFEDEYASMLTGDLLWMNGTDHQMPSDDLTRVVAEANSIQDDYRLEITSLAAYLSSCDSEDLATWTGELRSGARANLLMGVASNRVDVKQAAAAAERVLEREAEPLAALFLESWPDRLFAQ
ncbi:MAG: alpha-mannosidase, partial [bacterium]|nr:alpha-mannosidase [bacterium]